MGQLHQKMLCMKMLKLHDIAKTRNFGKKSLAEIKEKLLEWNLSLGMTDYSHLKNAANLSKQKEETDES